MPKRPIPTKSPCPTKSGSPPPPEVTRPRNGFRSGDALGVDNLSDPTGGGKVANPHITEAERISRESKR
jgi:hypothetical protein